MKRSIKFFGYLFLILTVAMVSSTVQATSGGKFALSDIPEIKNKQPLNTMVETGHDPAR